MQQTKTAKYVRIAVLVLVRTVAVSAGFIGAVWGLGWFVSLVRSDGVSAVVVLVAIEVSLVAWFCAVWFWAFLPARVEYRLLKTEFEASGASARRRSYRH